MTVTKVGNFLIQKKIGQGAFAEVRLAIEENSGEEYAVKIFERDAMPKAQFEALINKEIRIMRYLRHPNIVSIHSTFATADSLYIFMEYVRGGELYDEIVKNHRVDEARSRFYFQQIVDTIVYCHRRGVIHRDIKPENILIDDKGSIKVTDFGMSYIRLDNMRIGKKGFPIDSVHRGVYYETALGTYEQTRQLLRTQCGTPKYMAPEVIVSYRKGYDGKKIDAWDCGMVLYALLAGHLPFYGSSDDAVFQSIIHDRLRFPKHFSPGTCDVLTKLLNKNPVERTSLEDIRYHPWFLHDYYGHVCERRQALITTAGPEPKSVTFLRRKLKETGIATQANINQISTSCTTNSPTTSSKSTTSASTPSSSSQTPSALSDHSSVPKATLTSSTIKIMNNDDCNQHTTKKSNSQALNLSKPAEYSRRSLTLVSTSSISPPTKVNTRNSNLQAKTSNGKAVGNRVLFYADNADNGDKFCQDGSETPKKAAKAYRATPLYIMKGKNSSQAKRSGRIFSPSSNKADSSRGKIAMLGSILSPRLREHNNNGGGNGRRGHSRIVRLTESGTSNSAVDGDEEMTPRGSIQRFKYGTMRLLTPRGRKGLSPINRLAESGALDLDENGREGHAYFPATAVDGSSELRHKNSMFRPKPLILSWNKNTADSAFRRVKDDRWTHPKNERSSIDVIHGSRKAEERFETDSFHHMATPGNRGRVTTTYQQSIDGDLESRKKSLLMFANGGSPTRVEEASNTFEHSRDAKISEGKAIDEVHNFASMSLRKVSIWLHKK